jgi:hypothetical protein
MAARGAKRAAAVRRALVGCDARDSAERRHGHDDRKEPWKSSLELGQNVHDSY